MPVWVLDPENYRQLGVMHKWLPDVCRAILTSLSKLVILKQALISGITGLDGDTTYIGSDVLPYNIYTVELQMNKY